MTIAIIVAFIILILIVALGSSKKSVTEQNIEKNEKFYSNIFSGLPEPSKSSLTRLKEVYDTNQAFAWADLKKEIGIPDSVDSKDLKAVTTYLNMGDNEVALDFFTNYMLDITQRHDLEYKPLRKYDKNESLTEFQVNINANEELYEVVRRVEWHEEKVVRKNVNYSGYNWRAGGFHSGRLSYAIDVIKDFQIQDIGTVYLTNKRIIFIGKHKNVNRSINYDKILNFKLYQDGILLGLSSGKLPLLKFYQHDNTNVNDPNDAFITNDGMNQFVRVVSRILTGTQDTDLKPQLT